MKHSLYVLSLALLAAAPGPRAQEPAARTRFHWADANGDGLQDALVIRAGGSVGLLIADGQGGFLERTELLAGLGPAPLSAAAWGDLEGDGQLELIVVGTDGSARLFAPDAREATPT